MTWAHWGFPVHNKIWMTLQLPADQAATNQIVPLPVRYRDWPDWGGWEWKTDSVYRKAGIKRLVSSGRDALVVHRLRSSSDTAELGGRLVNLLTRQSLVLSMGLRQWVFNMTLPMPWVLIYIGGHVLPTKLSVWAAGVLCPSHLEPLISHSLRQRSELSVQNQL